MTKTENWIVFDDDGGDLGPLCDLRASFELRTGAVTTAERLTEEIGAAPSAVWSRPRLADLVAERRGTWGEGWVGRINKLPPGEAFTLVNGRWTTVNADLPEGLNTALVDEHGDVVAARLQRDVAETFLANRSAGAACLDPAVTVRQLDHARMLCRPWELLQRAAENLEQDLGRLRHLEPLDRARPGVTVVGGQAVLISPSTTVHPHVVFDTSAGPVAIDDGAEVRSMSVLVGPGYVGPGSIVTNHAHVRAGTIIGPLCKVGGEVNASLFHGHANKAHSGYLGNSYVGEWVNLGADTVTSNLKNTYGEVRMQVTAGGATERTGMTHLGSIIGDHVKTAIGTRLLTGSCIHTGAMLAVSGFPPKWVARFAFLTDDAEARYDLAKFLEVAETVMQRRGERVTDALRRSVETLYEAEKPEKRLV